MNAIKKLNVGIIGYGRNGCDIHSNFFKSEVFGNFTGATSEYYHKLYDHMVNAGKLFITPEHIRTKLRFSREQSVRIRSNRNFPEFNSGGKYNV